MGKIEDTLCEAIEIIVNRAISKVNFDRTIQANIVKCVDADTGKHLCRYQDATFYAYSLVDGMYYTEDTRVYILIPGNDMGQTKLILAEVKKPV